MLLTHSFKIHCIYLFSDHGQRGDITISLLCFVSNITISQYSPFIVTCSDKCMLKTVKPYWENIFNMYNRCLFRKRDKQGKDQLH